MNPHLHSIRPVPLLALAAIPCVAFSCGGGGGGSSGASIDDHEASLNALGVDTSYVARVDEHGNPLPDDYTPLGEVHRIDPVTELWFGGVSIGGNGPVARLVEDISALTPSGTGLVVPAVLHGFSQADVPWLMEQGADGQFARSLRSAVAADVDGDGAEELVILHFSEQRLHSTVVRAGASEDGAQTEAFLFNLPDVVDLSAVAGDFDGDRDDEIAVAYATATQAFVRVVDVDDGQFHAVTGAGDVHAPQLANGQLEVVLAAGRLDHDGPDELVIVINERTPSWTTTTRYHAYDDLDAGFATLQTGLVAAFHPTLGVLVATVANVALGDVDGDHLDEIVLAGLESLPDNCNGEHYVAIVLDDAAASFDALASHAFEAVYPGCDQVDEYQLVFPTLSTLDLDGDGRDEIQLDRFVFDDLGSGGPLAAIEDWELPHDVFLDADLESWFDPSTIATTTGDFDGDGLDEILIWRPELGEIRVYGLDATSGTVTRSARLAVAGDGERFPNPLLVAVDADLDSPVLVSVAAGDAAESGSSAGAGLDPSAGDEIGPRSTFLFHEPIVLAVLASPPFKAGIDQDADECVTTFGNTTSSGAEEELSVTFSSSYSVGFKVTGGAVTQSEVEAKLAISREVSLFASRAYDVSKTVSFTTGPNEDTVVFTTTPMDQYTYRFLHHPDPSMIGREIVITLPREPITLQAEREYYNAHLAPGGLRIDESVLAHRIGDPQSYPSSAAKDDLLSSHGGEQIGPQSVGQGSGATELEIEVSDALAAGGSLELGYTLEAEVTAGTILFGGTVGASVGATFQVTSGASTTYTGSVGSIGAGDYADHAYSFGLFTYVHTDGATGQQFEVIHYWVE